MDHVEPAALTCFLKEVEVLAVLLLNRYFKHRYFSQWNRIKNWSVDNHFVLRAQLPEGVTHVHSTPSKLKQLTQEQQKQLVSCCILQEKGFNRNVNLGWFSTRLTQLEIQYHTEPTTLLPLTNLQKLHIRCAEKSVCNMWYMFTNLTDLKVDYCEVSNDWMTLPASITSLEYNDFVMDATQILHLATSLVRLKVTHLTHVQTLFGFTKLKMLAATLRSNDQTFAPRLLPPNLVHLNLNSGIADASMFPASLRTVVVGTISDFRNLPHGLEHLTLSRFNAQMTLKLERVEDMSSKRCFHVQTTQNFLFKLIVSGNDFDVMPADILTRLQNSLHITSHCLVELSNVDLHVLQTAHSLPDTLLKLNIWVSTDYEYYKMDMPECPSVVDLMISMDCPQNRRFLLSSTFLIGCPNLISLTDNLPFDTWSKVQMPNTLRMLRFTNFRLQQLPFSVPSSLYSLTLPTDAFHACRTSLPAFQNLTQPSSVSDSAHTTVYFL
jgi:hypothetical protein